MEELADRIRQRIADGRFRVSDHAQVRLDERGLLLSEILASVRSWSIIETYHSDRMGPSLLAKHELPAGPIHAVWGMIDENAVHAVLVTVYLPDKEKWMSSSQSDARLEQVTRLVEEGGYIAKVPVTLIYEPDDPTNWGPYLSADDALKLDEVRNALRRGDVETAARHGEIFELTKVA